MTPVRAWYALLVAALVIVTLGACQSSAPNPVEVGPRASLAATYVTIGGIANLTESLHVAGAISDTEKAEVKAKLLESLDSMALVESLFAEGDPGAAVDRLAQVEAALTVLRDTLEARQ